MFFQLITPCQRFAMGLVCLQYNERLAKGLQRSNFALNCSILHFCLIVTSINPLAHNILKVSFVSFRGLNSNRYRICVKVSGEYKYHVVTQVFVLHDSFCSLTSPEFNQRKGQQNVVLST